MIEYESPSISPRRPLLRIEGGCVHLTVPPLPRWLEIGDIAWQFSMGLSFLMPVFGFAHIVRAMSPVGGIAALSVLWKSFAIGLALFAANTLFVSFRIWRFLRYCNVPREIELNSKHVIYRRLGLWGIRRRQYPVDHVTSIRLYSTKGLSGKVVAKRLTIKLGRWPRIFVVFNKKTLDMAEGVERAFRERWTAACAAKS